MDLDQLIAKYGNLSDAELRAIYTSPDTNGYDKVAVWELMQQRNQSQFMDPNRKPIVQIGPVDLGAAIPGTREMPNGLLRAGPSPIPVPHVGWGDVLSVIDHDRFGGGMMAPVANAEVPLEAMPPQMAQDVAPTSGIAVAPSETITAQEVVPEVQRMAEQLPPEQKQQMLDGMVKMLDKIVVEGEAPAERQEAVSRSAGDQRSEQPAPTSAGPAKPENAPDERTLALAQVYEVAASTGLLTPEALPFSKFVAGFDQLQGVGGQDDQMNRLLAKGEEKKAEFTEAPKEERKGPKISDMEDQMNQLAGYRNSNLGRTGA